MTSPPLSPTPRRWRSPGVHPDVARLTSAAESIPLPESPSRGFPGWRSSDTHPSSSSTPTMIPGTPIPEIRTTSPTPQRPGPTEQRSMSERSLSPLEPPNRGLLFDPTRITATVLPSLAQPILPQTTGESMSAAYDAVLSTLDDLASPRSREPFQSRLEAVSEHTEPSSPSPSSTKSTTNIANKFPLPPSPVKGPREKKASDLIKMFEQKSSPSKPVTSAPSIETAYNAAPFSSYHPPFPSVINAPQITSPPKPPSPLSNVRKMVASWRTRSSSPQRRGWNVSIRRKAKPQFEIEPGMFDTNEAEASGSRDADFIGEGAQEHRNSESRPGNIDTSQQQDQMGKLPEQPSEAQAETRSTSSKISGEPLRTGSMYYLNVHDQTTTHYPWVEVDARLYPEALQLTWRTPEGGQAMVTLDLEFCEEVASTYSPSNPMAGDDIGAVAARREGLDNLYPFKLVYDDGTERLGCDSARDRVRWVNAIWTALERTRAIPRPSSINTNRSSGSASTHYDNNDQTRQIQTTDDAVISTASGLSAPLTQRGSRKLVRGRSLRRVASEADLSDSPLTVEAATRPHSRDFTFAGGRPPPILTPPSTLGPTPPQKSDVFGSQYSTALSGSRFGTAQPGSTWESESVAQTAQPGSGSESYATAPPGYGSVFETRSVSSFTTARPGLPTSVYGTAAGLTEGGNQYETAPSISASQIYTTVAVATDPVIFGTTQPLFSRAPFDTALVGSTYSTAIDEGRSQSGSLAPLSTYSTVPPGPTLRPCSAHSDVNAIRPASEYETIRSGSSDSSFVSAPPIPPPHDPPKPLSEKTQPEPVRYQLYDKTVSDYSTAPPPPISRDSQDSFETLQSYATANIASERSAYLTIPASPRSTAQERSQDGWETATRISEPDPDEDILADLERSSSLGSNKSRQVVPTNRGTQYTAWESQYLSARSYPESQYQSAWETVRGSQYLTARDQMSQSSQYQTAHTRQTNYETAPAYTSPSSSMVPSQTSSSSTNRIRRVPVPPPPPPPPSFPSSVGSSRPPSEPPSEPPSNRTTSTSFGSSRSSSSTMPIVSADVNRLLNYLQGQDQARHGQNTRIASQLDRIENKVNLLQSEKPPPVPAKDRGSPTPSDSSSSSAETARPVTPTDHVASQLDDMRHLLGTLIGRTDDILQETARRRAVDVHIEPERGPTLGRIEDLLRRLLSREPQYAPKKESIYEPSSPSEITVREPSLFRGGSIYSDGNAPAPPNSLRSRSSRFSGIPESLIDGDLHSPDFDDEFAIANLPPDEPPREHIEHRIHPNIQRRPPPRGQTPSRNSYTPSEPEWVPELPEPFPPPQTMPREPSEREYEDEQPMYEEEEPERPAYRGPTPERVDLPSPVYSQDRRLPQQPQRPYGPMPGMMPGQMPGMMPGPMPGMEFPRPSLPRIAGVRDPISTTYFRRGFPPGPMMGMFPGPMGMPGPGMGPFMPGLRPGLAGFGGALGPNVNPMLRRPGFAPPGVPATSGDYGLPRGARGYGNIPVSTGGRMAPDVGRGNTTSESTASLPDEEIVTPHMTHLPAPTELLPTLPDQLTPEGDTPGQDSFRRALDNTQALATAQGEQQNEMSRYLHGVSDQIADVKSATQRELAGILADISRLRAELQPRHVRGHVLPDGQVVLDSGEVVDGIRAAPPQGPIETPPSPSGSHVAGKVLPDGTVMAGDKVVDGIHGAPHAGPVELPKDLEQDRKLAELEDKLTMLIDPDAASTMGNTGTPHLGKEKTILKEREIIREGPGGKEKTVITEREVTQGAPSQGGLSLTPQDPVPIVEQPEPAGQLIREETEEIIQRPPGGGAPTHTVTTTRTYNGRPPTTVALDPVGSTGSPGSAGLPATHLDPANGSAPAQTTFRPGTVHPDPSVRASPSVYGDPNGPHLSDHQSEVFGDLANVPTQKSVHEHEDVVNPPVAPATKNTSVSKTQKPGSQPAASALGDPSAKSPKPPKESWSTNHPSHPKPVSSLSNVPTQPAADPVTENDPGNAAPAHPIANLGDPAGLSDPSGAGPGDNMADPTSGPGQPAGGVAGPDSGGGKGSKGKGVHWDSRMPAKPAPSSFQNVPAATELRNVPSAQDAPQPYDPAQIALPASNHGDASAPGKGGKGGKGSKASDSGSVPAGASGATGDHEAPGGGHIAGVTPDHTGGHQNVQPGGNGLVSDHTVNNERVDNTASGPGLLTKSKPDKSNSKSSTKITGEGPPLVAGTQPLNAQDKNTSFSDTVHTRPPSVHDHHDGAGHGGSGEVHDAGGGHGGNSGSHFGDGGSGGSGGGGHTGGHNKLKKPAPGSNQADPSHGLPGSQLADQPGQAGNQNVVPPGTVPSHPVNQGRPGSINTPAHTGGTAGQAPEILERITLPDGREAFVKPRPVVIQADPGLPKTGKSTGQQPLGDNVSHGNIPPGLHTADPYHCSKCCPSGPKTKDGVPIEACAHQPGAGNETGPAAASIKSQKLSKKPPAVEPLDLPGEEEADASQSKGKQKKSSNPEEELAKMQSLATKQKAANEQAASEKAERERVQNEKAAKLKLAEDRHNQNAVVLADLKKTLDALANDSKTWRTQYDDTAKGQEKRRTDKAARDKKLQDALDKLVTAQEESKRKQVTDDKKPGTQAILDALKTSGDGQAAFLRKLATEITDHNSNQHKLTQEAAKTSARDQVGFNLAGYLDDFSKALSGEVRVLLKEVGDLRESRRALYMELAELLLMKGRQSAGDLMAILPYPSAPPKAPKPPNAPKDGEGKKPKAPPAWAAFMPPQQAVVGAPQRPLPIPGAVPPPPPMMTMHGMQPPAIPNGARPLPIV